MAINKYCNLYGENKIKDDYDKINIGFSEVETDVSGVLNSETDRETAETQREVNEVARQLRYSNTKHYSEYNNDSVYHTNNIVSYQGSSFMLKENSDGSILESQGFAPPDYPTEENERWKMVGKRGDKGDTGVVPSITVGTVTTLPPGNPVTVIRRTGSADETPIFDFAIPKGADGLGAGDVLWADIDQDHDGIIDIANTAADANKLGGQLPGYYAKETEFSSLTEAFNTHESDYTMQIPWGGLSTNISNAYSISSPIITSLATGMAVSFKCNVDSTGAVTLNWAGTGYKSVIKANGLSVTNWKNGGVYTVRFDGTNFQLQGEGGEYGTNDPNDVKVSIPFGTEDGIKIGTYTSDATAIAADVKLSKIAYANGQRLVGTNIDKKWRSGSQTIYGTSIVSYYAVVDVSGLDFKPSTVICWGQDVNGYYDLKVYHSSMPTSLNQMVFENIRFISGYYYTNEAVTDTTTQIRDDGFTMTLHRITSGSMLAHWIAFE